MHVWCVCACVRMCVWTVSLTVCVHGLSYSRCAPLLQFPSHYRIVLHLISSTYYYLIYHPAALLELCSLLYMCLLGDPLRELDTILYFLSALVNLFLFFVPGYARILFILLHFLSLFLVVYCSPCPERLKLFILRSLATIL